MKIYKTTDRIEVKVRDITIQLSPLTLDQKSDIRGCVHTVSGVERVDEGKIAMLSIMYSIKYISGATNPDGSDYNLSFSDNGNLTKECVEELLNSELQLDLSIVCTTLMHGIPSLFINPLTGKRLEGVEITSGKSKRPKKS